MSAAFWVMVQPSLLHTRGGETKEEGRKGAVDDDLEPLYTHRAVMAVMSLH